LLSDVGLKRVRKGKIQEGWGLGISKMIISQDHINIGVNPIFCGFYTERKWGERPERLAKHCRYLNIINLSAESSKGHECKSLIIPATHPKLQTRVGASNDKEKTLSSQGRPGYLQFGPYVKTDPGKYRITWFGFVEENPDDIIGEVDIVAGKGQSVIAKKEIKAIEQDGVLAHIDFSLKNSVEDLEFRFRSSKAEITLTKIRIECIE
jgi:hypothetical protein